MQDINIQDIWKTYDRMIEESKILNLQSWRLNLRSFETLQTQKAKSKLQTLILPKLVGIVLGVGWILFLGFLLYYTYSQIIIGISLGMLLIFSIIAIIIYIRNITVITRINLSDTVIETQGKIAFLQTSIVKSIRVLWLQLPFFTTCYITNELAATGGIKFWIIQITISLLALWLAVYLFKNISLTKNSKTWVKGFLRGYGLSRISKAMEFIKEIEAFKQDLI